jgi:outer membrane biosynthesis protein TonB
MLLRQLLILAGLVVVAFVAAFAIAGAGGEEESKAAESGVEPAKVIDVEDVAVTLAAPRGGELPALKVPKPKPKPEPEDPQPSGTTTTTTAPTTTTTEPSTTTTAPPTTTTAPPTTTSPPPTTTSPPPSTGGGGGGGGPISTGGGED